MNFASVDLLSVGLFSSIFYISLIPFSFLLWRCANPTLLSLPTQSLSIPIPLSLHLCPLPLIRTPLSVPSNLSPLLAPPLYGSQDSIIYSSLMLYMIWAIDEAISLSPLLALPSLLSRLVV